MSGESLERAKLNHVYFRFPSPACHGVCLPGERVTGAGKEWPCVTGSEGVWRKAKGVTMDIL